MRASVCLAMFRCPCGLALFIVLLGAGCTGDSATRDVPDASAEDHAFATYHNERFNYSVAYPANLLQAQGEAANADGQRFISSDGQIEMMVFGRHNIHNETPDQAFRETLRDLRNDVATDTLSYIDQGDDGFVISGIQDDRVFYQKHLVRDSLVHVLDVRYDTARQALMNPVVSRIAESFGERTP